MEKPTRQTVQEQIINRAAELLVKRMEGQGQVPLSGTPQGPVEREPLDGDAAPDLTEEASPAYAHRPQRTAASESADNVSRRSMPEATPSRQQSGHRPLVRKSHPTRPNRSIWQEHPRKIIAAALAGVVVVGFTLHLLTSRDSRPAHTAAAQATAAWEHPPKTVTAWEPLINQAARDPRIAVGAGDQTVNYVLNSGQPSGNGKQAGPPQTKLAEAVIALTSAGDPKYANSKTGQQGLIPLTDAARQKYANELNQTNQDRHLGYKPIDPKATDPGTTLLEFLRMEDDQIAAEVAKGNGQFPSEDVIAQSVASNPDLGNYSSQVQALIVELNGLLVHPSQKQASQLSPGQAVEAAKNNKLPDLTNPAIFFVALGSRPGYANLIRAAVASLGGPAMGNRDLPLSEKDYADIDRLDVKHIEANYHLPN